MDEGTYDRIIELLRSDGGRVTSTRKAVVRGLLSQPGHHVTAADVIAAVRAEDPEFQESTVYRTLDRLVELGAISQVHMGHSLIYSLGPDHRHDHLLCNSCGVIIEVPATLRAAAGRSIDREHSFAVDPDGFTYTGLCAACRAAPARST